MSIAAKLNARIRHLVFGSSTLILLDQVIASGTNFATTIILGRFGGAESLGVYALVFSISVLILTIQESLISLPYTIQCRQLSSAKRHRYLGSSLIQACLLASVVSPLLLIFGVMTGWLTEESALARAICAFALVAPMAMMRDIARRVSIAHLRPRGALAVDIAVSVTQISLLSSLAFSSRLNAASAWLVIGFACLLGSAGWFVATRKKFVLTMRRWRSDMLRNWRLGHWVLSSQVCSVLNGFAAAWLITLLMGSAAAGIFVGCTAIVLLSNPFILGMHNLLCPRIAAAYTEKGVEALRRVVLDTTFFLAASLSLFCAVVYMFGGPLTTFIYGESYQGYETTTFVMALAVLASGTGMSCDHALWVIHRPKVSFLTGLLGLSVTVLVTLVAIPALGVLGGSLGLLCGNAVSSATRIFVLARMGQLARSVQ